MAGTYRVYIIRERLSIQDPDMPSPRYHTSILVETKPETGGGIIHQVTGDITSAGGMWYEHEFRDKPQESDDFISKELLGVTHASTHPVQWESVLRQVGAPPQQKAFNPKTMKTEPFKTLQPLTFYEPREPRQRLIKCTEWTLEGAIPALKNAKLVQENCSLS
ncbi:hypothetical protein BDY21DRAFT_82679 [Lineolata rhizophorae]|uniref:Uncharacterized protein n=1 Tax=Lineolata rhizophorae TaxID=578093 RepID=A0A6A6PBV7_9PEZI|nr:hypothetical protein BDY21DRAFT_82679 [Lineolata rhizophorae]